MLCNSHSSHSFTLAVAFTFFSAGRLFDAAFPHVAYAQAPVRITGISAPSAIQGSTLKITLTGEGFVPGSTEIRVTGPGVVVNGIEVTSSRALQALLVLSGEPGMRSVSVAAGVSTSNSVPFQILANPSSIANATDLNVDHFVGSRGGVGTRDARGTEARFIRPDALATNSKYIFVSDSLAYTIRKIDRATGDVTTAAGQPLIYDVEGGEVRALWADENYLYIAKWAAISRLTIATGEIITFAGSPAVSDLVDGVGEQARFRGPYGLWGDGEFLYVLDEGTFTQGHAWSPPIPLTPSTIRQVSIRTREVRTIPIPEVVAGVTVQPRPTAIAGDAGILYLGYAALDLKFAIGRYTLATREFQPLAGFPFTPTLYLFRTVYPRSFWLDGRGSLYFINDENNGRSSVRRLSLATGNVSTLSFTVPGALVEATPAGIGGEGDTLFVADGLNTAVAKIDLPTMNVTVIAGLPSTALDGLWPRIATNSFTDAAYPSEQFAPSVVWGDGEFIYGIVRNAVYRVSLRSGEVRHLAGLVAEHGDADGSGANARFNNPAALWGDGRYLYVADTGAVRRIDLSTKEVTHFANVNSRGLWGDGKFLYVSTASRIDRINTSTRDVSTFVQGLGAPCSLWGDGTFLFVLDDDAPTSAIHKITLETGAVRRVAGFPSERVGPGGIWGNDGRIFLATGRTIRSVDATTGEMKVVAGDARLYGTEDGAAADARFVSPRSLWGDGRALYVADESIRRIEPAAGMRSFTIPNLGADSWVTNRAGPLAVSYARVQPAVGNSAPEGVAVFTLRQNGVLVSETAVPATALTQSGRTYAEINGAVNTGIAIANPNDRPAAISFYFTDANGQSFGAGDTTIAANAQIAAFMDQAPFNGSGQARTFTFSSSLPVGAIALRGLVNERSEFLMTTLPVAPLAAASTQSVVLPHFAAGGGWSTQILLVNPSDTDIGGNVQTLTPAGAEFGATSYRIAPRSSAVVDVSETGAEIRVGSVRIHPNVGDPAPIASTVFSFVNGGVTVTENGVAETESGHAFRLFVEASGRFGDPDSTRTGIAIANSGTEAAILNLDLRDLNGVPTGSSASITIPAAGQVSVFLHEIPGFSNLATPFEGVLRISTASAAGISMIGLRGRYNERGDFLIATMPSVNEDAPAVNDEKVFPHIANGDGYATQFILISRTTTSGQVRFVSQSGDPLTATIPAKP